MLLPTNPKTHRIKAKNNEIFTKGNEMLEICSKSHHPIRARSKDKDAQKKSKNFYNQFGHKVR